MAAPSNSFGRIATGEVVRRLTIGRQGSTAGKIVGQGGVNQLGAQIAGKSISIRHRQV
jgi:hypothetical protein